MADRYNDELYENASVKRNKENIPEKDNEISQHGGPSSRNSFIKRDKDQDDEDQSYDRNKSDQSSDAAPFKKREKTKKTKRSIPSKKSKKQGAQIQNNSIKENGWVKNVQPQNDVRSSNQNSNADQSISQDDAKENKFQLNSSDTQKVYHQNDVPYIANTPEANDVKNENSESEKSNLSINPSNKNSEENETKNNTKPSEKKLNPAADNTALDNNEVRNVRADTNQYNMPDNHLINAYSKSTIPASSQPDQSKTDNSTGFSKSNDSHNKNIAAPSSGNNDNTQAITPTIKRSPGRICANLFSWLGSKTVSVIRSATTGIFIVGRAMIKSITDSIGVFRAAMGGTAIIAIIAVIALMIYSSSSTVIDDDIEVVDDECVVEEADTSVLLTSMTEGDDVEAQQLEVANKLYSVLKSIGYTNEMCAGALGNLECEGNFDYTAVETISTEPFEWGTRKQAAEACDYDITQIDASYAAKHPLIKRAGIGLFDWTDTYDGANCNTELRNYCESLGVKWYESPDAQIAFLIDEENGCKDVAHYILHPSEYTSDSYGSYYFDSPEHAADWWAAFVEGDHDSYADRETAAARWFLRINELTYDVNYAESILNVTAAASNLATVDANIDAQEECGEEAAETNEMTGAEMICETAMALCWPTKSLATSNTNGIEAYQKVAKTIAKANNVRVDLTSCSYFTYYVIHFSGADANFYRPGCDVQLTHYLLKDAIREGADGSPPVWEYIGTLNEAVHATDPDKQLQPGDLIDSVDHTYFWLGEDIIEDQYMDLWNKSKTGSYENSITSTPVKGSQSAMASWHHRSPGIQIDGYVSKGMGTDYEGETYYVFRCINPTGTDTDDYKKIHEIYQSLYGEE